MYQHILLPLDGSEASESAIPHAEALALSCEAKKVTIAHVVEHERYEGTLGSGKRPGVYLQRTAKRLEAKGIATDIKVMTGDCAEAIVSYARENLCDIIVMASRGRSGVTRWAVGSVAYKVFRASSVPVLIVKAPKKPAKKPGRGVHSAKRADPDGEEYASVRSDEVDRRARIKRGNHPGGRA